MQSFDIVRETQPKDTFRVKSVVDKFELNNQKITEHFKGVIDMPIHWNIGMIVGNGARKAAQGTFGGYIESDTSDLNAVFILNGIQIESNSMK